MLIFSMKEGSYFMLGDDICIKYLEDGTCGYIKIGIDAPKNCKVVRDVVYERNLDSEFTEALNNKDDGSELKKVLAKKEKVKQLKSKVYKKAKKNKKPA